MTPRRGRLSVVTTLIALVVFLYGVHLLRSCGVYHTEVTSRPWAYSSDPEAKLLVGRWQGTFTDPVGVKKSLKLEIFVPLTTEELERKATRRSRNTRVTSSSDKRTFDGTATVTSHLGEEIYDVQGTVESPHSRKFTLVFASANDGQRPLPNQAARSVTAGEWNGDEMTIALTFIPLDANGGSSSTSEGVVIDGQIVWKDAPAEKPLPVPLRRD